MTLWEILKANKTGIAPDMFTMLAASKMNGGRDRLHELSGIPPLSFTSKGKPLTAWSITGNTVQNGTPTPENPVEVAGVGDYDSDTGMYKIPVVTSADGTEPITTPIYLDSPLYKIGDYADRLSKTEEVRVVKELVLTGKETMAGSAVYGGWIIKNISNLINNTTGLQTSYCSHYVAKNNVAISSLSQGEMCISIQVNNRINFVTTFATAEDFKAYLAAQYAAGTPVKVYYVMKTPETKTVEPVEIPTLNGTTVIDVDTAVKPESMTIKYRR